MFKNRLLPAVALAAAMVSTSANALTFNLIDTGGTAQGTIARKGFELAAGYWSSVFTDNVTINLQIGFSSLGAGILGSTGSSRTLLGMTQGYNALAADRTSALDNTAVANLRTLGASAIAINNGTTGAVSALTNGFANGLTATNGYTDLSTRIDNDGGVNNSTLAVTSASAKALGILVDVNNAAVNYNAVDANVTFSSNFAFDFDARDGIDANAFDFVGVAIHEIGHALGFVSGVDTYDARTAPGQTAAAQLRSVEGSVVLSQLDLFRYSDAAIAAGVGLDWSTQNTPFFSIDGQNQLFGDSRMSTGQLNGDGRQASHFKDSLSGVPQLGILDPTSGRGQLQEVTALDLAAFDAIGWNVNVDVLANSGYRLTTAQITRNQIGETALPEPATWGMMILGFGAVGAGMRRRKVGVVAA